jgi:uncharacterized cupin superfamily protein
MHILAGHGRFTPDGEDRFQFAGGDALFFEKETEAVWEIQEALLNV